MLLFSDSIRRNKPVLPDSFFHRYAVIISSSPFALKKFCHSSVLMNARYAPSRGNVADDATKWNLGSLFDPYCRWYQGPPFLQDPENQWLTE